MIVSFLIKMPVFLLQISPKDKIYFEIFTRFFDLIIIVDYLKYFYNIYKINYFLNWNKKIV